MTQPHLTPCGLTPDQVRHQIDRIEREMREEFERTHPPEAEFIAAAEWQLDEAWKAAAHLRHESWVDTYILSETTP